MRVVRSLGGCSGNGKPLRSSPPPQFRNLKTHSSLYLARRRYTQQVVDGSPPPPPPPSPPPRSASTRFILHLGNAHPSQPFAIPFLPSCTCLQVFLLLYFSSPPVFCSYSRHCHFSISTKHKKQREVRRGISTSFLLSRRRFFHFS